jgi:hypothetical protein
MQGGNGCKDGGRDKNCAATGGMPELGLANHAGKLGAAVAKLHVHNGIFMTVNGGIVNILANMAAS